MIKGGESRQPVYSPWMNPIERLWYKLHETNTHNHQCRGMANLLARVKHYMDTVSPFHGNGYGIAKVWRFSIRISYLVSTLSFFTMYFIMTNCAKSH